MCGAGMLTAKHPPGGYRQYVCTLRSGNPNTNAPVCPGRAFAVRSSEVDEDVWAKVEEIIRDEPRYEQLVSSKSAKLAEAQDEALRRHAALTRELADAKARQATVYERLLTESDEHIRALHRMELQRSN